jgi:hypothetical protein
MTVQETAAQAAAEAEREHRKLEEEANRLTAEDAECEQHEVEKKKPKMNVFEPGTFVASIVIQCPLQYTI